MADENPARPQSRTSATGLPPATDGASDRLGPAKFSHIRAGLRIATALISFITLIGSGLAWASYQNFTSDVPRCNTLSALASTGNDVDGPDQNILLVGTDSRTGATPAELVALGTQNDGGSENTDTMMVLHVPANGAKASIISFPRDSWVDIPENGKGKLNAAYGDGYAAAMNRHASQQQAQCSGLNMTIKTIDNLTGLHIDHLVQVDLLGFYRISNAIGGVSVCLNSAQNPETDSDAFGKGYSGINLPAGVSLIRGSQALAFVRQRHGLPNGDLDRIKRQQYFLASAFHKITTAGVILNPFKLHDLLNAVGSSLLVDYNLDLLSFARQFQMMTTGSISSQTIPNLGPQLIYPDGKETSIVQIDAAAMPGFIRQLRGLPQDPKLAAAPAATASAVSVDVLNGTSIAGLAGQNADRLKRLGFTINDVGSPASSSPRTVIQYPAGGQGAAKAVAATVPDAELLLTDTVQRTTLILGADGLQVRATTTPSSGASTQPASGQGSTGPSGPSEPSPGPASADQAPKPAVAAAPTAAPTGGLGCIN